MEDTPAVENWRHNSLSWIEGLNLEEQKGI